MQQEQTGKNRRFPLKHWHLVSLLLVAYDLFAVNVAYFFALYMRFDFSFSGIPDTYFYRFLYFAPIYSAFCLLILWVFRLYRSIWRFASFYELVRIIEATVITAVFHVAGINLLFGSMPISYYVFGVILQFMFMLAVRFGYRFVLLLDRRRDGKDTSKNRVMLIGAGSAGQMILRDLRTSEFSRDKVVCIIDDNPNKWNRYLEDAPVVGGREDILSSVEKYKVDKIYLAMPSASAADKRDILNICKETGCELKQLPGMYQLTSGEVKVSAMREVAIEDLLGRDPIKVDLDEVYAFLEGKTILVTGGGGSIGSELCRQIAKHHPKQLIIFDIYENNAYSIQLELRRKYPQMDLVVLIGSVRDSRRLDQVFADYRPDVVYHAAAHKHVPLMEDSPCEAIKNNAIGTYKTACAAMRYGVKRFILISTDKAVNPTNVMGASKRLCEMVIQAFDWMVRNGKAGKIRQLDTHDEGTAPLPETVHTEFAAVRFGNVLGSNGSVVPLFKRQIAMGGPVTVTHPDIIRYFMTIPEAVSLVLLAGTYAAGGEIFVLDMGEPVQIDTLARNLIKLSGFKPDEDIKIEYTGLRPGEKLYEEKLMAEEGLSKTANERIHIGKPIDFDKEAFLDAIPELMESAYANDPTIRDLILRLVSTYHPTDIEHLTEPQKAAYQIASADPTDPNLASA